MAVKFKTKLLGAALVSLAIAQFFQVVALNNDGWSVFSAVDGDDDEEDLYFGLHDACGDYGSLDIEDCVGISSFEDELEDDNPDLIFPPVLRAGRTTKMFIYFSLIALVPAAGALVLAAFIFSDEKWYLSKVAAAFTLLSVAFMFFAWMTYRHVLDLDTYAGLELDSGWKVEITASLFGLPAVVLTAFYALRQLFCASDEEAERKLCGCCSATKAGSYEPPAPLLGDPNKIGGGGAGVTTAAAGGSGGFGGAGWVSGGYTSAQVDGAGGFGSESGDDGDNPFASVSVSESSEGSVGGNKPRVPPMSDNPFADAADGSLI